MSGRRIPVPGAQPGRQWLTGERAHYLLRVLRLDAGATLTAFDGQGQDFPASVTQVRADEVELELGAPTRRPAPRRVTIVQGVPKADKLELVIQKGTELLASAFAPAVCRRTVVNLAGKEAQRQERWQRIAEEAARQSGRADVPPVSRPAPLAHVVASLDASTGLIVLDEAEHMVRLSDAVLAASPSAPLALVIGPEGGLDDEERAMLAARGASPVTLGPNVLRTETAALAALSVIRHLEGWLG